MTENEAKAIKLINDISGDYKCFNRKLTHEESLTLDRLLAEIQQYRAIGTVEDLKTMKVNGAFTGVELAQILAMQKELKKYQSIGAIEEFKALKEKQEKGLLLELPCKIGDWVWTWEYPTRIDEEELDRFFERVVDNLVKQYEKIYSENEDSEV